MSQESVVQFVTSKLKPHLENRSAKRWPDCKLNHAKIGYTVGKKFVKVTTLNPEGKHSSVYCFIDFDGNIFKAAGWQAPAKGIRGHIDTVKLDDVDEYGSWLYAK